MRLSQLRQRSVVGGRAEDDRAVGNSAESTRRPLRITLRRSLLVIAALAILMKGGVFTLSAIRLQAAWTRYNAQRAEWEIGRLLPGPLCTASESVLDAELALCERQVDRIAAFDDHRRRVWCVLAQERYYDAQPHCRGPGGGARETLPYYESATESLAQARASARRSR